MRLLSTLGGNIVFAAADAVTTAEVTYVPVEGDIIEDAIVTVATNVGTLLSSRAAVVLLEIEALAGTSVGAKTPVARGTTPSAGQAAINDAGTGVVFAAADAVTSARIKYVATPGVGSADASAVSNLVVESSNL